MVARYLMMALNGPTAGDGDGAALNAWHDDVHLPDFRSFAEVKSARRFKIVRGHTPGADGPAPWPMADWPFASVYEIETDDLDAVWARLSDPSGRVRSDSVDLTGTALWIFEEIGEKRWSSEPVRTRNR